MQANQRYEVLIALQAGLGAAIAVAAVAAYKFAPTTALHGGITITVAGLGLAAAIYYVAIHQLTHGKHAARSALILSILTAINLALVAMATGGLDSPYYALWLLAIVVAGLFGTVATSTVLGLTLAAYLVEFWLHRGTSNYTVDHIGQLAITLVTAGVAEWIHLTLGRNSAQHQEVKMLSGQLSQEALKSSALMRSMGEGVVVVNHQRQIQLFNPAAIKMTGWDEDSAQNIDYRLVLNLQDAAGNKLDDQTDPLAQLWNEEKSLVRNDLFMQTKGGHKVAISLSLSPIFDSHHKVNGAIGLFRDISAEKAVERQRTEFISTASHEMRTPVAAIEGYLSLSMNPAVATVDSRAKSYLEKAHGATQHLGELFQDLLSITKLEDQTKMDHQEIFDLTKLVEEATADMEFTTKKKGLELQFGAEGSVRGGRSMLPVYAIKGNQQRLREIIMNLIENAVKFTPQGSIHVTIGGTGDSVTVTVADSGIGIAPEDIPHLFQKFYRVDNGATRTIGGTGLGLYLCRTIVELLGGRIWVESKVGEGSQFKFTLPRQASDKIGTVVSAPTATATSAPDAAPAAPPAATAPDKKAKPAAAPIKIPVVAAKTATAK